MISVAFGASDGFADIPCAPQLSLTYFFVMIYTSLGWLEGQMGTKMLSRPAQPKTKFSFSKVDRIKRKIPKEDLIDIYYYSWRYYFSDKCHQARVTYYLPKKSEDEKN